MTSSVFPDASPPQETHPVCTKALQIPLHSANPPGGPCPSPCACKLGSLTETVSLFFSADRHNNHSRDRPYFVKSENLTPQIIRNLTQEPRPLCLHPRRREGSPSLAAWAEERWQPFWRVARDQTHPGRSRWEPQRIRWCTLLSGPTHIL